MKERRKEVGCDVINIRRMEWKVELIDERRKEGRK